MEENFHVQVPGLVRKRSESMRHGGSAGSHEESVDMLKQLIDGRN